MVKIFGQKLLKGGRPPLHLFINSIVISPSLLFSPTKLSLYYLALPFHLGLHSVLFCLYTFTFVCRSYHLLLLSLLLLLQFVRSKSRQTRLDNNKHTEPNFV